MRTKNLINGVWLGEEFPKHIQVAFGRAVFRLCANGFSAHPRINYLRDLPLNLADLERLGFPHALQAFRFECARTGINSQHISNL